MTATFNEAQLRDACRHLRRPARERLYAAQRVLDLGTEAPPSWMKTECYDVLRARGYIRFERCDLPTPGDVLTYDPAGKPLRAVLTDTGLAFLAEVPG